MLQGTKCVQWGRGHPSRSDRGTPPSPTPGQPLQQALSETGQSTNQGLRSAPTWTVKSFVTSGPNFVDCEFFEIWFKGPLYLWEKFLRPAKTDWFFEDVIFQYVYNMKMTRKNYTFGKIFKVWHFIHWAMKLVKQIYWSKQFHISFVSKCYNILLWKLKSLGVEDLWFINVLAMCKFSSYMLVYLLHHLSTPTLPGAQYVCSCLAFL